MLLHKLSYKSVQEDTMGARDARERDLEMEESGVEGKEAQAQ